MKGFLKIMMSWKDLEVSGRDLILRYYPGIYLEGPRKPPIKV
jgi:hypothetical protein